MEKLFFLLILLSLFYIYKKDLISTAKNQKNKTIIIDKLSILKIWIYSYCCFSNIRFVKNKITSHTTKIK